jgi:hypothetical protein
MLLIAANLESQGWEVYFFKSAEALPHGAGAVLKAYAKKYKDRKIAVVVDDTATQPNSHLFVDLLKVHYPMC